MSRVNLEVSPEMKSRWDQHAEEYWSGNLSAMIRRAVEREIQGGHEPETRVDAEVDLDPVVGRLEEVTDCLDRLEGRMDELTGNDPIEIIAGNISEWLPVGRPGDAPWEDRLADIRTGSVPEHLPTEDPAIAELAWQGTTGGLAQVASYPESLVAEALRKLERDVHVVHSVEHGGATRYYKSEAR